MSPIHEILLEASEADLDRLLATLPPDIAEQAIRGADLELAPATLSERVRALLGARTHQILFAPPAAARELEAAVRRDPEIHLEGIREIASAGFDFQVEAYSETVRDDIRGFLCTALPAGVRLTGFTEREERDPEAQGVELFAPMHELAWQAEGRVEGDPWAVLDLQRRAVAHDFCHPGPLRIAERESATLPGDDRRPTRQ
jgi:hypothetical protein